MIKLRKVKVIGNSIEAFYEDDETGEHVEVQGEFEISFFRRDAPEMKLLSLEKLESCCKHCETTDWEPIDLALVDTYELEYDVMNQIDTDEYKEYSL